MRRSLIDAFCQICSFISKGFLLLFWGVIGIVLEVARTPGLCAAGLILATDSCWQLSCDSVGFSAYMVPSPASRDGFASSSPVWTPRVDAPRAPRRRGRRSAGPPQLRRVCVGRSRVGLGRPPRPLLRVFRFWFVSAAGYGTGFECRLAFVPGQAARSWCVVILSGHRVRLAEVSFVIFALMFLSDFGL